MLEADLLTEFLPDRGDSRCVVARQFDALSDEDRPKLEMALSSDRIAPGWIADWLREKGLRGSSKSIRDHRKGACCCDE